MSTTEDVPAPEYEIRVDAVDEAPAPTDLTQVRPVSTGSRAVSTGSRVLVPPPMPIVEENDRVPITWSSSGLSEIRGPILDVRTLIPSTTSGSTITRPTNVTWNMEEERGGNMGEAVDNRRTETYYLGGNNSTNSHERRTLPIVYTDNQHIGVAVRQGTTVVGEADADELDDDTQQVPVWAKIGTFLLIAIAAGCTNGLMVMAQYWLNKGRLYLMKDFWKNEEFVFAALSNGAVAALYCASAGMLVLFLAPKAAGSGLPEMKGYLNGCKISGMFGRMGWVRAIGAVLTVSSGMPLGREGPMVSTGGQIGISFVDFLLKKFFHQEIVGLQTGEGVSTLKAKILDVSRFKELRRHGAMIGAAAGVAAAFNSPIGGCLYIYEEVSGAMKWNMYLTTISLAACAIATYVSYVILFSLSFTRDHLGALVLTGAVNRREGGVHFNGYDMMGAIAVGIVTALFTRCFAFLLLKVTKMRTERKWNIVMRLVEVLAAVFFVAFMMGVIPELSPCVHPPEIAKTHPMHYTCDNHDHVEVATFTLGGLESGVQFLLDQSVDSHYALSSLAITFFMQVIGILLIFSLPMPIGMFVPNLFFGAVIGRFMGESFHLISDSTTYATPGVYAFWGMGGALTGFSHMTIAIAALIVEATHDIENSVPLVVCIIVARLVAGYINHEGFDEEMLVLKNVPFLHHSMPRALRHERAADLMEATPLESHIRDESKIINFGKALRNFPNLSFFPVVNHRNQVVGVIDRHRLTKLFLKFVSAECNPNETFNLTKTMTMVVGTERDENKKEKLIKNYFEHETLGGENEHDHKHTSVPDVIFPLRQLMEPTRFLVIPSMTCSRFYSLFVSLNLECVAVVDGQGMPIGLIPRENLVVSPNEKPREKLQRAIKAGVKSVILRTSTITQRNTRNTNRKKPQENNAVEL